MSGRPHSGYGSRSRAHVAIHRAKAPRGAGLRYAETTNPSPPAASGGSNPQERMIRLAMIGCGGISNTHRARFAALADRLAVTACVDLDASRAAETAKVVGAKIATAHLE